MEVRNMTVNMSNITNILELTQWANTESSQLLGLVLLVGLFMAIFFGLGLFKREKGFATSAFVTTIISLPLAAGGFIPESYSLIFIIITLGGIFFIE